MIEVSKCKMFRQWEVGILSGRENTLYIIERMTFCARPLVFLHTLPTPRLPPDPLV